MTRPTSLRFCHHCKAWQEPALVTDGCCAACRAQGLGTDHLAAAERALYGGREYRTLTKTERLAAIRLAKRLAGWPDDTKQEAA